MANSLLDLGFDAIYDIQLELTIVSVVLAAETSLLFLSPDMRCFPVVLAKLAEEMTYSLLANCFRNLLH